jgi:hypothetical protein
VEGSYELSLFTVKAKKAHTIGETVVKLCLLTAVNIVLCAESQNKLSKILLSDNRVKCCIDELADDIKRQVLEKNKSIVLF